MYLYYVSPIAKVIYPKNSKHWPSTVAHSIDFVCSKVLNHGLNHGLLFSLFKFWGWKNILNNGKLKIKTRFLLAPVDFSSAVFTM